MRIDHQVSSVRILNLNDRLGSSDPELTGSPLHSAPWLFGPNVRRCHVCRVESARSTFGVRGVRGVAGPNVVGFSDGRTWNPDMTFALMGQDHILVGWWSKIEVLQVPGRNWFSLTLIFLVETCHRIS